MNQIDKLNTYLHSSICNIFRFDRPHLVDFGIATVSTICTFVKGRRRRSEYVLDGLRQY
jgi:hypothetical protein